MKITYAVLQAFVEAFTEQYDLDYEVNRVLIRGVYPVVAPIDDVLDDAVFLIGVVRGSAAPSYQVYEIECGNIEQISPSVFGHSLGGAIDLFYRTVNCYGVDFEDFQIYGSDYTQFDIIDGKPVVL